MAPRRSPDSADFAGERRLRQSGTSAKYSAHADFFAPPMTADPLSRRERQILDVLYARGSATAADVLECAPGPAELLGGAGTAQDSRVEGPRATRTTGHALRLPSCRASRQRQPIGAHANRQDILRGFGGPGGGRAPGFFNPVGRRAQPLVVAHRTRQTGRTLMDLDLFLRTSGIAARGSRRSRVCSVARRPRRGI